MEHKKTEVKQRWLLQLFFHRWSHKSAHLCWGSYLQLPQLRESHCSPMKPRNSSLISKIRDLSCFFHPLLIWAATAFKQELHPKMILKERHVNTTGVISCIFSCLQSKIQLICTLSNSQKGVWSLTVNMWMFFTNEVRNFLSIQVYYTNVREKCMVTNNIKLYSLDMSSNRT